ncbi:MAG: hypothetical protein ACE366_16650 [Bradymonadia bacterium]
MSELLDDINDIQTLFLEGAGEDFPHQDEILALLSRVAFEVRDLEREAGLLALDEAEPPTQADDIVKQAGEQALAWAIGQWEIDIREPRRGDLNGAEHIDGYIRGESGLSWRSADRKRLGQAIAYTRNNQFHWCGAFAAAAWGNTNWPVELEYRQDDFASVDRLFSWGWDREAKRPNLRRIPLDEMRAGDILVMGNRKRKRRPSRWPGAHIAIVDHIEGDSVHTVEGNAIGVFPDSTQGEGVVRCVRPMRYTPGLTDYYAMYAYRPLLEDLVLG